MVHVDTGAPTAVTRAFNSWFWLRRCRTSRPHDMPCLRGVTSGIATTGLDATAQPVPCAACLLLDLVRCRRRRVLVRRVTCRALLPRRRLLVVVLLRLLGRFRDVDRAGRGFGLGFRLDCRLGTVLVLVLPPFFVFFFFGFFLVLTLDGLLRTRPSRALSPLKVISLSDARSSRARTVCQPPEVAANVIFLEVR